ncbi:MAG: hypothetical protein KQJ78_21195 [Deltaproteobacteria bacterium]|nr:hypothetical protein [Deltaproteobacteria bacterium]
MIETMRLLVQLQAVDKAVYDLEQERDAIPGQLVELSQEESRKQALYTEAKARLDETTARRKDLESSADEIRGRLKRAEQRLMGSKTTKEYQAANAEIEEGRDRLKVTEDLLLEVMEQFEALDAKVKTLGEETQSLRNQLDERRQVLAGRVKEIEDTLGTFTNRRESMASQVDPEIMEEYNFIRERRQGIAMAPVSEGNCGICHIRLPPQQFNELQRMDRMMVCPSCRRICYWADGEPFQNL